MDPILVERILHILELYVLKGIAVLLGNGLVVGVITFSVLDIFLNNGINFKLKKVSMEKSATGLLFWTVLLWTCTILPIVFAFAGQSSILNSLIFIAISNAIITFIISKKMEVPIGFRHFDAIGKVAEGLSGKGVLIVQKMASGVINFGIKLIHRPFIIEYGIIAVLINIALSIFLVSIMGASKEAGMMNMMGGALGGIAHAIIRRKEITRLKALYLSEDEKE